MKEFIKCRDWIINKKNIMYVGIEKIDEKWVVGIDLEELTTLYEKFDNETEARKEFDNICKQLQEEEIEWTENTKGAEEPQPKTKFEITLKEFWESDKTLAIHCDTEEKAKKLLKAFDKLGKKWNDGGSYLEQTLWSRYNRNTCYNNENKFCYYDFYKEHDYEIYEFDEVDLKN